MAERRMFTAKITEADEFTALPPTTQCLYFHLCMSCDDDGFSNKIRNCMFAAHADNNDFELLVTKRFVIPFESGVVVIKHWRMHNLIRADRYHETDYLEEKARLLLKDNGSYTERQPVGNQVATSWQPSGNQVATEVSIGKVSKGKRSIKRFEPPTLEDVKAYAKSRGNKVDAQKFYDYYTAGNWVDVKGNPVKNWKQKMITWESKHPAEKPNKFNNFNQRTYDYDELRELVIK